MSQSWPVSALSSWGISALSPWPLGALLSTPAEMALPGSALVAFNSLPVARQLNKTLLEQGKLELLTLALGARVHQPQPRRSKWSSPMTTPRGCRCTVGSGWKELHRGSVRRSSRTSFWAAAKHRAVTRSRCRIKNYFSLDMPVCCVQSCSWSSTRKSKEDPEKKSFFA